MKLYYVRADSDDGENMDLMVWSETKEQAIELWQAHYGFDHEDFPDPHWVGAVPTGVPATPTVIDWSQIN